MRKNSRIRYFFLSVIFSCLTGCSIFAPVKNSQEYTYVLNTLPCPIPAPHSKLTLLVTMPQTSQVYNTSQIAYMECPHALAYFSKNYWIDTPPQMLLPLIVQSLQNTCHYHAIVTPPYYNYYDLSLNTQLVQLYQDFLKCPSRVHVVLRAQLINSKTDHVIAEHEFCIVVPACEDSPYGGVVAANHAVKILLQQLTQFCLHAG